MKKVIIITIIAIILICGGVAFYRIYSNLNMKMADPHLGVLDGDGMINPNAVAMACESIQGEYERGVGSRVIIDGTHFTEKSQRDNVVDTTIVDAYSTSDAPDRLILKLGNDKGNRVW